MAKAQAGTQKPKTVGEQIAAAREKKGISQRKLGRLTGIKHQTISTIEQGGDTKLSTLRKLAQELGIKALRF